MEHVRVIRYDTERVPPILLSQLKQRGWLEYDEEKAPEEQPPWNLWWKTSRFTVSQLAAPNYPHQRLNHFPKTGEITKKDTLMRNIRRMKGVFGQVCDFLPTTFTLPGDYVKFCQDYAAARDADPNTCYICKPSDMSRGRKIFLFRDIGELTYDCSVVVQRYISNPLCMAGYKFDLRIYVLVTAFQPLRAYVHRNYLIRFATEKYELSTLDNLYSHLTNSSINKLAPGYTRDKDVIGEGCKWDGPQFEAWLRLVGVPMDVIWTRIETVVMVTLLSISPNIPSNPACFELYGFDLIIDDNWKPWLLEVNLAPALQIDGDVDRRVKGPLVGDMIDVLNIPEPSDAAAAEASPPPNPQYGRRSSAGGSGSGSRIAATRSRPMAPGSGAPRAPSGARRQKTDHGHVDTGRPAAAAAAGGGAAEGGAAPRPRRTASQTRLSEVKAKVSAGRSVRTVNLGNVQGHSGGPETPLQDRPAGGFELIFPFNDTVAQCSARMSSNAGQDKDGSMRTIMQEIRKLEQPAFQKGKAFKELHQTFIERLKKDPSILAGIGTTRETDASGAAAAAAAKSDAAAAAAASDSATAAATSDVVAPAAKSD
eukprot:Hpha_TRINITY_DN16307_c1_g1::TRINITY_DN16307_c1_g1_i1::g.59341::m.59341/K16600/TTLL2; tubulin polyglutamylase TTLL2